MGLILLKAASIVIFAGLMTLLQNKVGEGLFDTTGSSRSDAWNAIISFMLVVFWIGSIVCYGIGIFLI